MSWFIDRRETLPPRGAPSCRCHFGLWVLVVVVIGIILFVTWPTAGYRVVVEKGIEVKGDTAEVVNIAHRSFARVKDVTRIQRFLTFTVNHQTGEPRTPGVELATSLKPGDLLESDLRFNIRKKYGLFDTEFSASISIDGLLDAIQRSIASICGQVSYVFAINAYDTKPASGAVEKVRLLAHIYPSDKSPSEFPKRGQWATQEKLVDIVTWYLYNIFEGDRSDCRKELCSKDISSSLTSLEVTKSGYEILLGLKQLNSKQLNSCEAHGAGWCMLKDAEKQFRAALKEDPSNAHAHLGIGIIEMQRARNSARKEVSAYTIGRHFIKAINSIEKSRANNEYIRGMIGSAAWKNVFDKDAEWRRLGITTKFLEEAQNYNNARQAMIKTKYKDVIRLTDRMLQAGPPEWLISHLKLLKYYAALRAATSRKEALGVLSLLKSIESTVAEKDWAPIYGIGAAQWSEGAAPLMKESRHALERSVSLTKERSQRLEAEIHQVRGLIMLGDIEDARTKLNTILKSITTFEQSNKKLNEAGIGVGLAMAFTALGEYENAVKWLDRAVRTDTIYVETAQFSPYFRAFRGWGGYRRWLIQSLPETTAPR